MEENRLVLYEECYKALEQATLDLVKPHTALTLTGGLDTRVMGAIISDNGFTLPCVLLGSKIENVYAQKTSKTLGFKYFRANKKSFMGKLRNKGFQYVISGSLFDEVNGSWTAFKAKSEYEFWEAQKKALRVGNSLLEKERKQNNKPLWVTPILNKKVQVAFNNLPFQWRIGKAFQRWILKTKFPELWNIPYYNSFLPNFIPYGFHGVITNIHLTQNVKQKIRQWFK